MVRQTARSQVDAWASSEDYRYEDACSLYREGHLIPRQVADFLDALEDRFDNIEVAATGCPSCFSSDAEVAVWYVAQSGGTSIALRYDSDDDADMTDEEVGEVLTEVADDHEVDWSWDNDPAHSVMVGPGADYYERKAEREADN